ncbi:hypothetical protein Z043_124661, partial [Scleropages formosus]
KANPPVDTYSWFKKNGTEISQRGSWHKYNVTNIRPEDNGLMNTSIMSVILSGDIVEGSSVTLTCNSTK